MGASGKIEVAFRVDRPGVYPDDVELIVSALRTYAAVHESIGLPGTDMVGIVRLRHIVDRCGEVGRALEEAVDALRERQTRKK